MLIRDYMSRDVIVLHPEETVLTAARLMSRHNIGSIPVCTADHRLRGIVTDRDVVLRCVALGYDPEATPVSEIMTRNIVSLPSSAEVSDAPAVMAHRRIRRVPVTEGNRLVGVITLGDITRRKEFSAEAAQALCEISDNIQRL